jgi:phosphoserine phosphatase RsbU/P
LGQHHGSVDRIDSAAVQDELQQRAAYERQLIGIVSHDLRNPISAIIIAATFLSKRTISTNVR